VEQNLPKEVSKESYAECEAPVIILNDTLRSHPNYSEVISSFLANVNESYHMGETTTDTIDCSNIVNLVLHRVMIRISQQHTKWHSTP